jgi:hypothetical protein
MARSRQWLRVRPDWTIGLPEPSLNPTAGFVARDRRDAAGCWCSPVPCIWPGRIGAVRETTVRNRRAPVERFRTDDGPSMARSGGAICHWCSARCSMRTQCCCSDCAMWTRTIWQPDYFVDQTVSKDGSVPGANSMCRSMALSGRASPLATDPNIQSASATMSLARRSFSGSGEQTLRPSERLFIAPSVKPLPPL